MGIDSIGAGFNPHLLSDLSPVNAAISALVLPSAFRPVPDPGTPTGSRWEMDPTLLVSAEVTNQNPFTVTYKIRPEAQWTDNAPIAADDFWYLWRQMVSQPGVVDPAGYDLITGVQSLEGGKTGGGHVRPAVSGVEGTVQQHPAGAHRQGRAGRFRGRAGPGAAGHRRAVPGGEHRPAARRNPAGPQRPLLGTAGQARDQILFRRAGAPAALADSVRNGDTQVAQVHGGSAAFAQLSAIPDVRTARIVTPRVMQLTLRANEPKLSDAQVRKAILGLLDVDLLAAVGAGSDNTVTLDQAQIRSPSDPGYEPTAPPAMTTPAALALLAGAGYKVEGNSSASPAPAPPSTGPPEVIRGRISKDGQQLSLVIGVAANDPTSVAVANTAADQLRNVGIAATRAGAGPGDAVSRRVEQQPGRRDRRLAPGRRQPGDAARVALRLPGAAVDAGIDVHAAADHTVAGRVPSTGPAPPAAAPTSPRPAAGARPRRAGAGAVATSPGSAIAAFSRTSMPRSMAPRTSTT